MWKYNSTDELYHAGVLGMKWGHHKSKNYNGPTLETKNYRIGLRAFETKGANERKTKINQKLNKINQTKPGSQAYVNTKIKADKINSSRYGKTNGRLITEGILKGFAVLGVKNIASHTAQKLGKKSLADTLDKLGKGALIGNELNTYIRIGANYRDKNRKNK